jgi:hypothetical protein
MKLAQIETFARSLPEVTQAPHHHFDSFRVRGKIFVTVPPGGEFIHVFVPEPERETALALHPDWVEKLLWGGKVVGLRISLVRAKPSAAKALVHQAWRSKAPAALQTPS